MRRLVGVMAVAGRIAAACGTRTGLLTDGLAADVPKSSAFCVRVTYESGHSDVALYVLLDKSLSTDDAGKWGSATAAIAALVRDPNAAGMGFGLQFFPSERNACVPESYDLPAVPVALLPSNADAVISALAKHKPEGITPTWLVLHGIARGIRDPQRARRRDRGVCKKTLDLKKVVAATQWTCADANACTTGCGCGLCGACTLPACIESCQNDGSGGRQVTCTLL